MILLRYNMKLNMYYYQFHILDMIPFKSVLFVGYHVIENNLSTTSPILLGSMGLNLDRSLTEIC